MSKKERLRLPVVAGLFFAFVLCMVALFLRVKLNSDGVDSLVKVGTVDDFPPHSVKALSLPVTFWDPDPSAMLGSTPGVVTQLPQAPVEPVPIWLVHSAEAGYVALYARDPFLGCQVAWEEPNRRFVNPCHGQKYAETGIWIEGPAERSLDRFGLVINDAGELWVDIGQYQEGQPLPTQRASSRQT